MARRSATPASGSASATSASVRITVSGLRSSWLALATKRACLSKASAIEASSRPASEPAERGGQQRRAAEREQVLQAELGERGVGGRGGQRAVEMARHEPPGDAQQQRDQDDEEPAVEGGEADAEGDRHTR